MSSTPPRIPAQGSSPAQIAAALGTQPTPPQVPASSQLQTPEQKFIADVMAQDLEPQAVRVTEDGKINLMAMPSVLLQGEQNSGKTHAVRTLLNAGIKKVVVLALEPGIQDVLGDLPPSQVQWKYIAPYKASMDQLIKAYKTIQSMSYDSLQKQGHIDRGNYQQFIHIMEACNNFVSDRDGEVLGAVSNFPQDWAFVLDGLSGLNVIVQHFLIGLKPFLELRDYQAIQNQIMEFLSTLTNDSKCLFAMMAHLERETDENTGISYLTMSTIGRKLAPKLGRFFSDVILTEKVAGSGQTPTRWRWATESQQVKCKTRNLPHSSDLKPDFKPLIDAWRAKQEKGQQKKEEPAK
jgi:hypothetical protein